LFGIGLAGDGIQFRKCFGLDLLISGNLECADKSLRSFLDLNVNCQTILVVVIVVVNFGLNFGLAETFGNVQSLKTGDIILEQGFGVAAGRKKLAGRLDLQALPEQLPGEIFVSGDLDEFELMHRARIDAVGNADTIGGGFLLKSDSGVEVAPALQIVQEVPLAFVEEVVVESIFLVDGDFSFKHAAADVKAQGVHHDHRSRFNQERIVDGVGLGVVFLFGDGYLGKNALLLLQFLAEML